MTRSRSALARVGASAILALALSACIKLDMALTVNDDDTVDGTIVFALNKQLIELSGQSPEDLLGTEGPIPTDAEGISTAPYEDDRFQGQEVTLDAVPLAQFNQESGDADSLRIVREGERFVVSGALDLSDASGATGASGFPNAEQIFESAEMKLAITFPGEVLESNGKVDGNTVTWVPKVGERLELRAVARAKGGGGSTLTILLIVGAVVVILAIVLGVAASRRRRPDPALASEGAIGDDTPAAPPSSSTPPAATTTELPSPAPPAATPPPGPPPPPPPPPGEPQP